MTLACIRCEGSGVVRHVINNAGTYELWHCPHCRGVGRAEYTQPLLKADFDKRRFQEHEQQQAEAKAARASNAWLRWLHFTR